MKQIVTAIYDHKAKAYLTPFFTANQATAIRAFGDAVNNPESLFNRHAEDYTLFYLGEFDQETAKFTFEATAPDPMITGLTVLTETAAKSQKDIEGQT